MRIGAVIPAYNEQKVIENCLKSLRSQSIITQPIIVVNDGSEDKTEEIAIKYADEVVNLPKKQDNRLSSNELAKVYNAGFTKIKEDYQHLDYIIVVDADTILPENYIEKILQFMEDNNYDLASGVIEKEEEIRNVRGSGRIISWRLFQLMDYSYPVNYGFDSFPSITAIIHNLGYGVNRDVKFRVLRPTSQNYTKDTFIIMGRALRAYGNMFIFAFKSLFVSTWKNKSIIPIMYGLYGYFSLKKENRYPEEIRKTLKSKQKKILKRKLGFSN